MLNIESNTPSQHSESIKPPFLKSNLPEFLVGDEVKWNFTKFLIDKQGKVIKRYESMVNPLDIAPDIEKLL